MAQFLQTYFKKEENGLINGSKKFWYKE